MVGTITVNTAASYNFWNNVDDGNRMRIDLNQDNIFQAAESLVPDGGLQGQSAGPYPTGFETTPAAIAMAVGVYRFVFQGWSAAAARVPRPATPTPPCEPQALW